MSTNNAEPVGTDSLSQQAQQYLAPNYGDRQLAFTSGRGMWLYTPEGEKYLDFLGGIAVCSLGHCYPKVTEAIQAQAEKLIHISNLFLIEPQIKLAAMLVENSFADRVFFCNSGAEANEAALKLAKKVAQDRGEQNRYEVVSLQESFHGRTIATLSATGQHRLHEGFKPLLPGFSYLPANDLHAVEELVTEKTCAVIVEPIQGESGIRPLSVEYLRLLREICTERQVMLIVDEIQTGMGRTGKLFAFEHAEIEPDIVTMAKGLGNGLPIGAMLAREEVMQHLSKGSHGSTFGGNPLVCSAALATLSTVIEESFMEHINTVSEYLFRNLRELRTQYPKRILDIRGKGLMVGIELDEAASVHRGLLQHKVVTNCIREKIIRLLPPLIVTEAEIDVFINEFAAVLEEIQS